VHDYSRRPNYADIEKILKLISVVDSLAVFEVRGDDAARGAARDLYERYKFDPR
jgi:hypothetical protein